MKSDRLRQRVARLKRRLRRGGWTGVETNNIAVLYRQIGNRRRAFFWWTRTAGPQFLGAWLEVGYCLHYGIGTRRDLGAAIRAYRLALGDPEFINEFDREEAMYHLAVALLDDGGTRLHRRQVIRLLQDAASDGDYPAASNLWAQLRANGALRICRCRRELPRRLGGKAHCALHRS